MALNNKPGNRAPWAGTERKLTCFNCHEEGHKASACKKAVITCSNCKKMGHLAPQCGYPAKVSKASKGGARSGSKNLAVANSLANGLHELEGQVDAKVELALENKTTDTVPINAEGKQLVEDNKDELLLQLISQKLGLDGDLPMELQVGWQHLPLYKVPVAEATGLGLGQRFQQAVPDELLSFRAKVQWHFLIQKYSEKSLTVALSKTSIWLGKDVVWTPELNVRLEEIIWGVYYSRHEIGTFWDRMKLMVYDKSQEVMSRPSTWVAIFVCDLLLNLGIAHHFGSIHGMLITGAMSLSCFVITKVWQWYQNRNTVIVEEKCETLEDYCTGTTEVEAVIDSNATITIPALQDFHCPPPLQYQVGISTDPDTIWCPHQCTHNLLNAVQYRQCLPAIGSSDERKIAWQEGARALCHELPADVEVKDLTPQEKLEGFLLKFPEKVRAVKRNAYTEINGSYHIRDCVTKGFVKVEWLAGKSLDKRNPRLVSAKTDQYLMEVAPEYYWYQKAFCRTYYKDVTTALEQKYIYTGGMTPDQIGAIFAYYVNDMGYDVIEGDYSRYDGHTEVEALEAEMQYYEDSKQMSAETIETLQLQYSTRAISGCGVKFTCKGKVASGVINTSFGNTLRGFMIVAAYASRNNLEHFAVMQLGDDNILFVRDIQEWDLPRFVLHCTSMGHKLEAVYRPDPEFAEYCSMRFWNVGSTYVLGPKPGRVLAKTFVCHDSSLTHEDMPAYCNGIAVGFKHYRWIPVLGGVVDSIMRQSVKHTKKTQMAVSKAAGSNPYKILLREELTEVDPDSVYRQFEKIYGFDPKPLEEIIYNHKITYGVAWHHSQFDVMSEIDGIRGANTRPWYKF